PTLSFIDGTIYITKTFPLITPFRLSAPGSATGTSMLLSAISPAAMSVPRRKRGKSVDTGGLALALSDSSHGLGHGWGGWDETETGETRYAEVLIDVRAHTESIVNPAFENVPSPTVSSFPASVPTSPNPPTFISHTAGPSDMDADYIHTDTPGSEQVSALQDVLAETSGDDVSRRLIESLSSWHFEPHKLSSDEVLSCALLLFEAFLQGVPGGVVSGLSLDCLPPFLYHLQTIYRETNTYHNFEHALDTFQALYHFLSVAGIVPDVMALLLDQGEEPDMSTPRLPCLLDILTKEDVMALCIAAVGHDAGHPGLTNGFMKNAQTPLSVLYDDKSVLEQMHYSLMLQVMRRTGLSVLLDGESGTSGCKKLLNAIILATDLGVHDQFMQSFEDLISNGISATDPFKAKVLACQALIKCADISNPARPYTVSQHWAAALSSEWSSQVILEKHLHLPPSVYPSVNALGEAKGQVFFIGRFAGPLFKLVGRGIPPLEQFSEQCQENLAMWRERLDTFSKEEAHADPSASSDVDPHLQDKQLQYISSRVTSPEHFLSAFPPALPKSFVSPGSSSNSDTDEDVSISITALRHLRMSSMPLRHGQSAVGLSDDTEDNGDMVDEDDGDSLSGSSAYETCESSPPCSPSMPLERTVPPKLEISTSHSTKHRHSHSRTTSHTHKRRDPSITSPTYLVSPTGPGHHRAPSTVSNTSAVTAATSASISANATAAIRAAYKASVRKKPSERSFNRSSWNPPPAEYKTFVTAPTSPQPESVPSPMLPPVVFTEPGFSGPSQEPRSLAHARLIAVGRSGSAENLSPLTPESSTTGSDNVSPLTPDSTSPTLPPDARQSASTFGMAPVYQRIF
ncbi:3',5'-cyclic-nucleotide phosphodiesterase, partial [Steccherinum ochraceum]